MQGLKLKGHIDTTHLALLVGLPLLAGAVLGANQTRAGAYMPWAVSILYWCLISVATWWLFAVSTYAVRALLRPWTVPAPLVWLAGALFGSFLARPAIYAIVDFFRPAMASPSLRSMVPARLDLGFVTYYLTNWSLIIGLWLAACWWLRHAEHAEPSAERPQTAAPSAAPAASRRGILLRTPRSIGHDVIALQAEDHYVRVHTRLGNALVLGSLSDAIDDVVASGVSGQRTHRSWWVASSAVVAKEQRGRQLALVLCNGVEAPVSVSYRQLAVAGGLIAG